MKNVQKSLLGIAVIFLGSINVVSASEVSTADLQRQIAVLLEQVSRLQAQLVTPSPEVVFTRSLRLGDKGADVLSLQKLLNANAQTQIVQSGPGSPGFETEYFGQLTKSAVIRYQNLYRDEILTPVGLSYGTGYVGFSTREKLQEIHTSLDSSIDNVVEVEDTEVIVEDSTEEEIPVEDVTTDLSEYDSDSDANNLLLNTNPELDGDRTLLSDDGIVEIIYDQSMRTVRYVFHSNNADLRNELIARFVDNETNMVEPSVVDWDVLYEFPPIANMFLSESVVIAGSEVIITGLGYSTEDNTIYFSGSSVTTSGVSLDGVTLNFTVPELPLGEYKISVGNSSGISIESMNMVVVDIMSELVL